jgi:hypothetical protein
MGRAGPIEEARPGRLRGIERGQAARLRGLGLGARVDAVRTILVSKQTLIEEAA